MKDKPKDYEKKIIDIDEVVGTDIKINPDYYIHNAIMSAQKALADENLAEGIVKFRIFIEHIEVLSRSAGMLQHSKYEEEIEEFMKTEEYTKTEEKLQSAKLANKKLELLMKRVFQNKPIADSISL